MKINPETIVLRAVLAPGLLLALASAAVSTWTLLQPDPLAGAVQRFRSEFGQSVQLLRAEADQLKSQLQRPGDAPNTLTMRH
jgi:hypothetical protein